ncbi:MAG: NYN domain-containing protein [Cytophagales bacterium]|nr:NYN domain-containing protein [Rhizobacter sp.]
MNSTRRVMLLIDADNVSAAVIEQAIVMVMAEHGAIHVRRAYCTAESAVTHQKLFKAHSIRPIVNLSSGKNANDIALAVDAMDLAVAERPDVAVIVSSDSDFAPLVIRLREKGCRVEGIGQLGKTGDDSKPVYDHFVDLVHQKKSEAAPSAPRKRAAPARKAPAPALKPAKPVVPPLPDDVQRILAAIPELRGGDKLELRIAAERLRADGLLTKNAPSTKLFKKYLDFFALTPERQPNKVQYRAR